MLRKTLRILSRAVKTVPLLIALAALLMWPVSRGRWFGLETERSLIGTGSFEHCTSVAACWDGYLDLKRTWDRRSGAELATWHRDEAEFQGPARKWKRIAHQMDWSDSPWVGQWWVFRWRTDGLDFTGRSTGLKRVATNCWPV